MEKFKIKMDKNIPLHYHLIKVIFNNERTKMSTLIGSEISKHYDGHVKFINRKPISNL